MSEEIVERRGSRERREKDKRQERTEKGNQVREKERGEKRQAINAERSDDEERRREINGRSVRGGTLRPACGSERGAQAAAVRSEQQERIVVHMDKAHRATDPGSAC